MIQMLEGTEGYREIIKSISEARDEGYGMQFFKAETHETSGLDGEQMKVLECGVRCAVAARATAAGRARASHTTGARQGWRRRERRAQTIRNRKRKCRCRLRERREVLGGRDQSKGTLQETRQ